MRRGMPGDLFRGMNRSVIALRRKKRGDKARRTGPTVRRAAVYRLTDQTDCV
jgi:hypothetical protein